MDATLISKKELNGVSELIDELVSIGGVYFQQAKDRVSLFYPKLDLGKLDFLQVVCDNQLVDEDMVAP